VRYNKTRQVHQNISKISGGFKKQNRFLAREDRTNNFTIGYRNIWMEYFENLLSCEEPAETFIWPQMKYNEDNCPPPTLQEVERRIKRLKNNKSSGLDGI